MNDRLTSTNDAIAGSIRDQRRRQVEAARARRPIRAIDELIADLEELHLEGRKRVPDTWEDRLLGVASVIPAELRPEMRSRITIVHLMDRLYDVQQALLRRRVGSRLFDDDEDDLQAAS